MSKGKQTIPVNFEVIDSDTIERITNIVEESLKHGASSIAVKHQEPRCNETYRYKEHHECNIKATEYATFKVNVTYFA